LKFARVYDSTKIFFTRKTIKGIVPGPLAEGGSRRKITISNASIKYLEYMAKYSKRFSPGEVDSEAKGGPHYMNTYLNDMYPFIPAGASGKHLYIVPTEGGRKGEVIKAYDSFNFYGVASAAGHGNPDIVGIMRARAGKGALAAASFHSPSRAALDKYLFGKTGGLFTNILPGYKFYMLNSGSESNDAALKLACEYFGNRGEYEQRDVIIAMHGGFHGRTGYAINLNAKPGVIGGFPKIDKKVVFVKFGDVAALAKAFGEYGNRVMSVHYEPIQGESGIIIPGRDYLPSVREFCDRHGSLMVADEVQTFARTGDWFASIALGARPDIIVTGKITSGAMVPVSIIYAAPGIEFGEHRHGNTYTGNPLACDIALFTLRHIHDNALLANSRETGEYLVNALRLHLDGHPLVKEARGMGAMVAIELEGDATKKRAFGYAIECANRGLLISTAGNGVLRMLNPLSMTRAEADFIAATIHKALDKEMPAART